MQVILTENVKSLGNVGEIVNVSPGHARNFLIPSGKASVASADRQKMLKNQQLKLQKKVEEEKKAAEETKKKIEATTIEMTKRVGGSGTIFGSVSAGDLAKELEKKGINVEKRMFFIESPIKQLGDYTVKVRPFTGVEANLAVKVEMDPNQVEEMQKASEKAKARKAAAAEQAAKDEALKKEMDDVSEVTKTEEE